MKKINKETLYKITPYLLHISLLSIILIMLFLSMKFLNNVFSVSKIFEFKSTVITILFWISFYLILKGFTGKTKISLCILILFEALFDIINYIVRSARGSSITISDIFAIKTALGVAKNVNLHFDIMFVLGLVFIAAAIFVLIFFREKFIEKKNKIILRIFKILVGFMFIFVFLKSNMYYSYSLWYINDNYAILGTPITIFRMLEDINVKAPDGYNKNEARKILESYNNSENKNLANDSANIIVIVNESFFDYNSLYNDAFSNPIEYFTELSNGENVISGINYSSEYGGRTANVEYEFLTQNSTKILPTGSYAFQQYISNFIKSSLVENLKSQGYTTSAIHPWESLAYSRNKIYPLLGFENIKFIDDIYGLKPNFNNEFPSDKSTYQELIRQIRNKNKNEKLFGYVLTVQNHTGYTNPDPYQITYHSRNDINVYMQLTHESIDALKDVIEEIKNSDEKYVLLFFGDHQPNLDNSGDFIEKSVGQYEVPFLIWANYDIEEQYNVKTSTIFLQNYLLKAAGVKFSNMNNYMEELQSHYPVITKRFCMDSSGAVFKTDDNSSKNFLKIQEYEKIDYYRIFDEN